jgi:hypothetical protein
MAASSFAAGANDQGTISCSSHISTAMNHLSIIEYNEPVSEAAVGSPAFQIERQQNKVFIKPLRTDASTNLFVWTVSNRRFCYELAVGDVASIDAETQVSVPKPQAPTVNSSPLESIDAKVTQALLGVEVIKNADAKLHKRVVAVQIEEVFRSNQKLFLRYSVANHTQKPYRLGLPDVYQVRLDHPSVNLSALQGNQLDQRLIDELGEGKDSPLSAIPGVVKTEELAPGAHSEGIIAIEQPDELGGPAVLRVIFAGNFKATVVL